MLRYFSIWQDDLFRKNAKIMLKYRYYMQILYIKILYVFNIVIPVGYRKMIIFRILLLYN